MRRVWPSTWGQPQTGGSDGISFSVLWIAARYLIDSVSFMIISRTVGRSGLS